MADSIIHFGSDTCNRVLLLENVGYTVYLCGSILELQAKLKVPPEPAAILINGLDRAAVPALTVIRAVSIPPPLVFFEELTSLNSEYSNVDLIIPPLTPPKDWLKQVAALIERNRATQQSSVALREQSARLRMESTAVRANAATIREQTNQALEAFRTIQESQQILNPHDNTPKSS